MVKFRFISFILISLGFLIFSSCTNNSNRNILNKPIAMSKSNDVVVVADDELWKTETGDTFRFYFESAYPITPSPEPIFNLRYFSFDQIEAVDLRRHLRTYVVLANLQDTSSNITKMLQKDLGVKRLNKVLSSEGSSIIYGQDKWARDQLVVYVVGKNVDELINAIDKNFNKIADRIHKHDEKQIASATYFLGDNGIMDVRANKALGINIHIPKDYIQAMFKEEEKILWGRRDSKKAISNFIIKAIEYKDTSQFSKLYLKKLINKFGKYVSSDTKNSRLIVNDVDLPLLRFDRIINGNRTLELRGIWEMTDDFIGGAFIAYLIKNKESNDLAFILGFVYTPGNDKKEYLQQMMSIVNTVEFDKK